MTERAKCPATPLKEGGFGKIVIVRVFLLNCYKMKSRGLPVETARGFFGNGAQPQRAGARKPVPTPGRQKNLAHTNVWAD